MTRRVARSALVAFALLWTSSAEAGHELPFYPGYYPQEIRVETVSPSAAGPRLAKGDLHAFIGAAPLAERRVPADIRSVESFGSYLVLAFNPSATAMASRERRCEAAFRLGKRLSSGPAAFVVHPYPITPYDPDYLEHFDLAQS